MPKFLMEVIPEPEKGTAVVFVSNSKDENFMFFKSDNKNDYICGKCRRILCEKIELSQIKNIVLKCPSCESHNLVN